MIKRSVFLFFVLFFAFRILLFNVNGSETEVSKNELRELSAAEIYSVVPEEKIEWSKLKNTAEKVEVCRIEKDILESMNEEELLNATLKFPLRHVLFSYNTNEQGLRVLEEISSAYAELLTRKDAYKVIKKRLEKITGNEEDKLEDRILKLLLSDPRWEDSSYEVGILLGGITTFEFKEDKVKTPEGNDVEVMIGDNSDEFDKYEKRQLDEEFKNAYPNAILIRNSSALYNCHCYAWHSQDNSGRCWMNNPMVYMMDGSYYQYTGSLLHAGGCKIYYPYEHSGIVQHSGPVSEIAKLKVISKWGKGPLMKHTADDSPYSAYNLSLWKR